MATTEAAGAVKGLTHHTASLTLEHGALPLWFKPELFLEPQFSPTGYVADLRRYVSGRRGWRPAAPPPAANRPLLCRVPPLAAIPLCQVPLETLSSELRAYLEALKNKLVEVRCGPAAAAAASTRERPPAKSRRPATRLLRPSPVLPR